MARRGLYGVGRPGRYVSARRGVGGAVRRRSIMLRPTAISTRLGLVRTLLVAAAMARAASGGVTGTPARAAATMVPTARRWIVGTAPSRYRPWGPDRRRLRLNRMLAWFSVGITGRTARRALITVIVRGKVAAMVLTASASDPAAAASAASSSLSAASCATSDDPTSDSPLLPPNASASASAARYSDSLTRR